jgi:cytokinin dehydrogenase
MSVIHEALSIESASEDFGHVMRSAPLRVVAPASVDEVVSVVADAAAHGARLTVRGLGHSCGGQALADRSAVLDTSQLSRVGDVDMTRRTIRCQGGARLREVVAETLRHGLLPQTLTNLLDLTIGGVLSVGGVGPGSHRYGPLVSGVSGLDVVTGTGELRSCSPTSDRELYDAVLGGLGRCGVIVAAELELRPVRPHVRTYYLLYDDRRQWLADQALLAGDARVSAMEGFCSPSMQGLRGTGGKRASFADWFYPLQLSLEFDDTPPDLPEGLSPYRIVHVEDDDMRYFPTRHEARFEAVRRIGAWERAHPYISAFITAEALAEVLPDVLHTLPLGEGHRGAFFLPTDDLPPFLVVPDAAQVVFFSVIYPQILPAFLDDTLRAFAAASELFIVAGGKRYVADWLGEMDQSAWRRHFGARYDDWVTAKQTFDPHDVFHSLLLS